MPSARTPPTEDDIQVEDVADDSEGNSLPEFKLVDAHEEFLASFVASYLAFCKEVQEGKARKDRKFKKGAKKAWIKEVADKLIDKFKLDESHNLSSVHKVCSTVMDVANI